MLASIGTHACIRKRDGWRRGKALRHVFEVECFCARHIKGPTRDAGRYFRLVEYGTDCIHLSRLSRTERRNTVYLTPIAPDWILVPRLEPSGAVRDARNICRGRHLCGMRHVFSQFIDLACWLG